MSTDQTQPLGGIPPMPPLAPEVPATAPTVSDATAALTQHADALTPAAEAVAPSTTPEAPATIPTAPPAAPASTQKRGRGRPPGAKTRNRKAKPAQPPQAPTPPAIAAAQQAAALGHPATPGASEEPSVPPPGGTRAPRSALPTNDEMSALQRYAAALMDAGMSAGRTVAQLFIVLLKGWELGMKPLQAARQLYIAQDGEIALRAEAQRALIEGSGVGYIQLVEANPNMAVVQGVRYGVGGRADRVERFSYTIAELGQVKQGYLAQDTLTARATTRCARAMFADVISGSGYDPEELGAQVAPGAPATPPQTAAAPSVAPQTTQPQAPVAAAAPAQPPAGAGLPPSPSGGMATTSAGVQPMVTPPAPTPPPPPVSTGRELTTPVQLPAPGGGVNVIQTAGIGAETLRRLSHYLSAQGGLAYAEKLREESIQVMQQQWGVAGVQFLREEEGQQLLVWLEQRAQQWAQHLAAQQQPQASVQPQVAPQQPATEQQPMHPQYDVPISQAPVSSPPPGGENIDWNQAGTMLNQFLGQMVPYWRQHPQSLWLGNMAGEHLQQLVLAAIAEANGAATYQELHPGVVAQSIAEMHQMGQGSPDGLVTLLGRYAGGGPR